jgi:hypothetical protein
MTRRLAITIAAYIDRYGAWPHEVRLSSMALWWIARSLDEKHFALLATRLKLRVTKHSDIAVGGPAGHLVYGKEGESRSETVDWVERELGLDLASRSHDDPVWIHQALVAEFGAYRHLHRLVIGELLKWTDLGAELGLDGHPSVSVAPLGGLFDFRLDYPDRPPAFLDIWPPTRVHYQQQADAAPASRRIYILLLPDGARPDWPEADGATWILRPELVEAVALTAFSLGGDAFGDLARAYSARLSAGASRAETDERGSV